MATEPLKPPAPARRIRALDLRGGERPALTTQALEELFHTAHVLAEGGLSGDPPTWYGSILITFRLDRLEARCRDLGDPHRIDRLVEAIGRSERVRLRVHRLACAQIRERHPDRRIGTVRLETSFRRADGALLLDVDLEAPLERASSRGRAR